MDIALKAKRALATLSAGAIFASSAGIALANHSVDADYSSWYGPHLANLQEIGAVDDDMYAEPAKNIQRDEAAAIAARMTDCAAGYEASAKSPFSDLPMTAWSFPHVDCLYQLGVISGYKDEQGNMTGMFMPGNKVNRGELVKMVTYAFGSPEKLDPVPPLSDMQGATAKSQWWWNPAATAYNWSIVDGKPNGTFDPAGLATRAESFKIFNNALTPVERPVDPVPCDPETDPDCEEPPVTPPTSDGDLEVSLNADTPAASTLPMRAVGVPMLAVDFTADNDDVVLTQVEFTRGGVGLREDFEECFVYEGAVRLGTGKTINDTNMLTFPLKNVMVEAGTTTTLTLICNVADENTAGPSNQHYFFVAAADDVQSNAKSTTGDFPVTGETFTIGGANTIVSTAVIEAGTDPSNVKMGALDEEVASFTIEGQGQNDLGVYWITLTQGGSLASDKLVNCRLLRGNEELATAEGFESDRITFALENPYIIPDGQSKTFYVNCDIDGGRSGDTIEMYVDEDNDAAIWDMQYGFGADIDNQLTLANANEVALEGDDLVVTDMGPAATQIASDSQNVTLLDYSLSPGDDLQVRFTEVLVTVKDASDNVPTFDGASEAVTDVDLGEDCGASEYDLDVADATGFTAGDMVELDGLYARVVSVQAGPSICTSFASAPSTGTLTEHEVQDYIEDVRIVNADTESTVAGPLTFLSSGSECTAVNTPEVICPAPAGDDYFAKEFTEDYDLTAGEAMHLSIRADLAEEIPAGYRINAAVQYPENSVKRLLSNEFVDPDNIIGAGATALAGDYMVVAESGVTVTLASTPNSNETVKGSTNVPTLGISMSAGDAEDVVLKRLNVLVYADDDGTFDNAGIGDVAANTLVSSVTLYDGNDVVSGPEGISLVAGQTYYQAQFDDLSLNIPAGETKTLVAKVNLLNTANATRYLALDVDPADITVEDTDGDDVTASGDNLNLEAALLDGVKMTILTQGTLTASSEGNPDASIVVAGSTLQLASKYRFSATDEAFMAKTLTICNDLTGDFCDGPALTSAVKNVVIKYPNMDGVVQTKSAALSGTGSAKFSGLDFYIPAGKDVFLEVYADVNTMAAVGQSLSGKEYRLGLQNVDNSITNTQIIGQSSSFNETFEDGTEVVNSGSVDAFVVRKTKPTVNNVAAGTTLSNSEVTLHSFSVTADAAGSLSFGRFIYDLDLTDADGGGELDLEDFKITRTLNGQSQTVTDANIFGAAAGEIGVGAGAIGGDDAVIVSFEQEESVAAGTTVTYSLRATGVGTETDDTVSTKLAIGDENTPVTGIKSTVDCGAGNAFLCSTGNGNTGRLSDNDANDALIVTGVGDTEFTDTVGTARNFLWSDKSADAHTYPTINGNGEVTDGSGTFDFTNGYLLDIDQLTSHTVEK